MMASGIPPRALNCDWKAALDVRECSKASAMQQCDNFWQKIGEGFVQVYYNQFDNTNRMDLVNLYAEGATMTWEGTFYHGREAIGSKLTSLPFQQIKHIITDQDVQPTVDNSILIMVFGQLKTDNDPPMAFHQVFMLKVHNCNWVCTNDVFRLGIHNIPV
ncbi:nuclear transport factor 2-like isoform X1 [Dunckerocampus dactyliophorus]|uniref:nuclear transport factor 2-like isoform X1 n=2 Tax=Dunckerocampus dactyliophorus TaxID=161453 RepID=UPI002404BB73|nr:nuclear transport factor 2-like isoform X1 [Dunckerocampus dactyliophorus]